MRAHAAVARRDVPLGAGWLTLGSFQPRSAGSVYCLSVRVRVVRSCTFGFPPPAGRPSPRPMMGLVVFSWPRRERDDNFARDVASLFPLSFGGLSLPWLLLLGLAPPGPSSSFPLVPPFRPDYSSASRSAASMRDCASRSLLSNTSPVHPLSAIMLRSSNALRLEIAAFAAMY